MDLIRQRVLVSSVRLQYNKVPEQPRRGSSTGSNVWGDRGSSGGAKGRQQQAKTLEDGVIGPQIWAKEKSGVVVQSGGGGRRGSPTPGWHGEVVVVGL